MLMKARSSVNKLKQMMDPESFVWGAGVTFTFAFFIQCVWRLGTFTVC